MSNAEEKISIIIPVYNTALYLEQCIKSIQNQTYNNIEIILVDDGSSDESGIMCDEFQKVDNRIVVVHKKNGGILSARLAGINLATGKYIGFVDGDDWIDAGMYETLASQMLKFSVDMVAGGLFVEDEIEAKLKKNGLEEKKYQTNEERKKLYFNMIYSENFGECGVLPSLCCKLLKKELIKSILNEIDLRIQYGEDAACVYAYMVLSKSVYISEQAFYHYRMRNDSIMHSRDGFFLEKINALYDFLKKKFRASLYSDILLKQLNYYILRWTMLTPRYLDGMFININSIDYVFPVKSIKRNSRIVLYGAGAVGKSYYQYLKHMELYEIVAWVDRNSHAMESDLVKNVESIVQTKYDSILIAINNRTMAEAIIEELLRLGVEKCKILWFAPINVINLSYLDDINMDCVLLN